MSDSVPPRSKASESVIPAPSVIPAKAGIHVDLPAHEIPPPRSKVLAAFAAIYIIWGSTYLGIRFVVETMPPFLTSGVRFLIAGSILFLWSWFRDRERPTLLHWRNTAIVGALLLLGGNGGVSWAVQFIPSGAAALLVAIPWLVLIDWARPHGIRPSRGVLIGLVVGLIGVGVLIGPSAFQAGAESGVTADAGQGLRLSAVVVLLLTSISWATGSIYSRHAVMPGSSNLGTGMQMLCGGALLAITGIIIREPMQFDPAGVSAKSLAALVYLIVIGSLIGYSAYMWLLKVAPPARVATHAYVNPVVAVFLGWALAGEELSVRTVIAAAIIVGAVALVTTALSSPGQERS